MKKEMLYLECYSGISGDMTVAALLDLGADQDILLNGLNSLPVSGFQVKIGRRIKSGVNACDFDVILQENFDSVQDKHFHGNDTSHTHKHCHPIHRNLFDITKIIETSSITPRAKIIAKKIFQIVAEAEAQAHGVLLEQVHFHEVGALDSIADIVGVAICLDNLNINQVILSELYEGTGHITCQHGILPIPVPAVSNIVCKHRLPLKMTTVQGEMVTPTGAAIAAAIRTEERLPERYIIKKIGLGAGKRTFTEASGILRAMIIEAYPSLF